MPKIYNVLPPPIEEMDEVLAFIYTGPCKPTKADFQRTPLLVRCLKVSKALHWSVFDSPPRVSMESSWSPHSPHGVLMESSQSPHNLLKVLMECPWILGGL